MTRFVSIALLSASLALSPVGAQAQDAAATKGSPSAKTKRAPAKADKTTKKSRKTTAGPRFMRPGVAYFLSHGEFVRLTRREQKEYLRELKKIMGSLPGMSENFADATTGAAKNRKIATTAAAPPTADFVAALLGQAEAWRGEESLLKPSLLLDSYARDKHRERMRNSIWWLVNARLGVNDLPDSDPRKKDLVARIDALEANYLDYGKSYAIDWLAWDPSISDGLKALDSARNKRINSSCNITPHNGLVKYADRQPVSVSAESVATKPADLKACEEQARKLADEEKSRDDAEEPPADPAIPVEQPPEILGYRCMYAGFVIKEDPCRGPSQLPEGMSFKGIDAASFVCEADEILCNPLLFGVVAECELKADAEEAKNTECLAQAKPLCVPRGKYATRECATRSAGDKGLESAATLIKMNPEVWRDYRISFYELCDDEMIAFNGFVHRKNGDSTIPERTLTDVRQTCENAKGRLTKLVNDYRVDGERPPRPGAQPAATEGEK